MIMVSQLPFPNGAVDGTATMAWSAVPILTPPNALTPEQ